MTFGDDVIMFQMRLTANLPSATTSNQSTILNLALAFLSKDTETQYLIAQSAPNITLASSSGVALVAKAADYGVQPYQGAAATGSVVFSVSPATTVDLLIPAGTTVSTTGDGVISTPVSFTTQGDTTISASGTSSSAVAVQATTAGTIGNVNAGSIIQINLTTTTASLTVTNADPTSGGLNEDSDAVIRSKSLAAIAPKYSAAALEVVGETASYNGVYVYDCYVYDPQDGSGTLTIYWADINGAVTNANLLAALKVAIGSVLPIGIDASTLTYNAFTLRNFTGASSLQLNYSAPAQILNTVIEPQIQTAVVAYLQSLEHNIVPTIFSISQYVQAAVGYSLTNLSLHATPSPDFVTTYVAPAENVLWRCTGGISTVQLFRV